MPSYRKAGGDVHDLIDELVHDHHPDLAEAETRIGVLFAAAPVDSNGVRTGPALKLHGYPAAALVRINSVRDRAEGKPDATILLDGDEWPDWPDAERRAVIDHELTHLEVLRDDKGVIKSDDLGRPRLKMRLHDLVLGGFATIAERHGEAAFEVKQARALQDEHGQLLFSWAEGPGRKLVDLAGATP